MSDFESSEMWDRDYPTEEEINQMESIEHDLEGEYEEVYEDEIDLSEEFDEEFFQEEQNVMDNARVRLEQGRLYEMLIKHDLFDGVDALPEAIDNVQKELKSFIMERLEILLGMKAEKETQVQQIINEPQFNDMEVQALKMMAAKVTKGASTNAPTTTPTPTKTELNTIPQKPKASSLNSLSQKKKPEPKPLQNKAKSNKRKVQQRKRVKKQTSVIPKETANMSVDDIAKKDINYIKSLENMSLEEANRIVSERHKRPTPKSAMTMNGGDEQQIQDMVNSHYQHKTVMHDGGMDEMTKIMKLAALQKAQQNQGE